MRKARQSPLVSAEWLASRLDEPDIAILDASFFLPAQNRNAREEYRACHLPGARFFDIDAIADHSTALPHMLPSAADFASAAGGLGLEKVTTVVIYDSNHFMASARAWWTFRVFGHDRVRVLDGGLARWQALRLPLESGEVPAEPRHFSATYHRGLVRTLDDIRTALGQTNTRIVDARPPGRFSGEEAEPRPGLRSGHIPGSRNLFFRELVDDATFCLKSRAELERRFLKAGIDPYGPVITTCGSGVTAAILALALSELGNEYAAVYDGSWSEWGAREDVPVSRA